eukprot:GFUD01006069.1.p1 GENE.GFUD01006069.1~~GFUD01006069.1.p1  ORF type:complete len:310 (-),score=106.26 GFUD01006069.1:648-1577(-)
MTSKKADMSNNTPEKTIEAKNRGWPKGKRRYPKGVGAPKQPLSGYVHFLNERRESVRGENPDITFSDLSKKLAAEWSGLDEPDKNKYNDLARRDKDRYDKEFAEYQLTDSYKQYLESQGGNGAVGGGDQRVKKKKKTMAGSSLARDSKRNSFDESDGEVVVAEPHRENGNNFDIPIFTEEFLDHNKARELELRQLRKQTTEFEEQNAVLAKHIDSMKSAISKLEVETVQQRQNNAGLQQQLDMLRQMVVSSFRGVQLPGNHEPLTLQSVDQFVAGLHGVTVEQQGQQHTGLLNTVRDIVSRMDFNKIQG